MYSQPRLYAKLTKPQNGRDYDKESVSILYEDEFYEVEHVDMGQSSTSFTIKGLRSSFNSVQFSFYDVNKEEVDIYSMPSINPYHRDNMINQSSK